MIPVTDFIIKYPTKIRAGAVAADGIKRNKGVKNKANKKRMAVTTEDKPVRPPAATPAELSTKLVTVEVPKAAPATVPIASAKKACFTLGMFPSLSVNFAWVATPTSVPTVSKISNILSTMYGFVILSSIFTTSISLGGSFLQNIASNKKSYTQIAIIMCITSLLISKIGFSNLVNILYPIFGYLGLIQIYKIVKKA